MFTQVLVQVVKILLSDLFISNLFHAKSKLVIEMVVNENVC